MKKTLLTIAFILSLISCGSNKSEEDILIPLSVEEGKQELENNALNFLTQIDNFNNNKALKEIHKISTILNDIRQNKSNSTNFKETPQTLIRDISKLKEGKIDIYDFSTKQTSKFLQQETNLMDQYNSEKGIYIWNNQSKEFEKNGNSDNIIYKIDYDNKTAEIIISNFTVNTSNSLNEEFPTSITTTLTVNSEQLFHQNYTASIKDGEHIPNSINNTIILGTLSANTSLISSNNSKMTFSNHFTINDISIIGFDSTVQADYTDINSTGTTNKKITNIINSSNFSISLLDMKVSLTSSMPDEIPNNINDNLNKQIELLNKHVVTKLTIGNKLIASGQFYEDEYTSKFWSYVGGEWTMITTTEKQINLRFLFDDGTTSDFETYFNNSFSNVTNKIEKVSTNYLDKYTDI